MNVPANQPVSFTIYMQAIHTGVKAPSEFVRSRLGRIQRAYDIGEPVQFVIEEIQLLWDMRPIPKTKTPRQLAARVTRVGTHCKEMVSK